MKKHLRSITLRKPILAQSPLDSFRTVIENLSLVVSFLDSIKKPNPPNFSNEEKAR